MPNFKRTAAHAAMALGLSLIFTIEADAVDFVAPRVGGVSGQDNTADLRALENRIQRQQYQQQQQQFREEDRLSIPLQAQRPIVPVIRPGCQTQVYGNRVVNNCR